MVFGQQVDLQQSHYLNNNTIIVDKTVPLTNEEMDILAKIEAANRYGILTCKIHCPFSPFNSTRRIGLGHLRHVARISIIY